MAKRLKSGRRPSAGFIKINCPNPSSNSTDMPWAIAWNQVSDFDADHGTAAVLRVSSTSPVFASIMIRSAAASTTQMKPYF